MQKKVTVRTLKIVTEETDFIINYPTEEAFKRMIGHLADQPGLLNGQVIHRGEYSSARMTDFRELSEVTRPAVMGPEPTIYIYDAETTEVYFNNGLQPENP